MPHERAHSAPHPDEPAPRVAGSPRPRGALAVRCALTGLCLVAAAAHGFAAARRDGVVSCALDTEPAARAQAAGAPQPQAPAERLSAQSADELWRAGRRIEAADQEAARLASGPAAPADWKRLANWQLELHRPAAALSSAERGGDPCRAERGSALFLLARYEECLPLLDPSTMQGALLAIDANEALRRFAAGDAALESAVKRFGRTDSRLLAAEGRMHARLERFPEAVRSFEAALQADPCDAEAQLGLGRALLRAGRKEEGLAAMARQRELRARLDVLDHALRAVDLQPMHGPNWTAVGDAEAGLGRVDRALAAYERAEGLSDPAQLVPNALRHARCLWETRRDYAAADAVLLRATGKSDDPRLVVRRADLCLDAGRATRAVQLLEELAARRPDDQALQARLGKARAQAARSEEGRKP